MTDVHRFVTIQQTVLDERPSVDDLPTLLLEWGLTKGTQEATWVIAFDSDIGIKTVVNVGRGSFHDCQTHIPVLLATVLACQTDRFYVAHNHPAGGVLPTEDDIKFTGEVMAAANAAGMSFEDHIIVGPRKPGWYSFYEKGLLTRASAFGMAATRRRR